MVSRAILVIVRREVTNAPDIVAIESQARIMTLLLATDLMPALGLAKFNHLPAAQVKPINSQKKPESTDVNMSPVLDVVMLDAVLCVPLMTISPPVTVNLSEPISISNAAIRYTIESPGVGISSRTPPTASAMKHALYLL